MSQLMLFEAPEAVYTFAQRDEMNYILACTKEYDREMKLIFPKTKKPKPDESMMNKWRSQLANFTYA